MEKTKDTLISLNELARELSKISEVNKSRLTYYVRLGLLTPHAIVGKMQIFKKEETLEILKKIKKWRDKGKELKEIKELLHESN